MNQEIQKMCATCGKGENYSDEPCPTRPGCFTPDYINWVDPGAEKEDTLPTLFVSYQFYAAYESGEMHKDFGNIFLNVAAPTDEYSLCKLEKMISENIKIRIGFKTSVVTVLNFKNLK